MHVPVAAAVEAVIYAVSCAGFEFLFHVVERELLPELCRAHVSSDAAQCFEEDGIVVVPRHLLEIFGESQVVYITALALSDVDNVDAFIVIVQERGKHTFHDFFLHGFNINFFHETPFVCNICIFVLIIPQCGCFANTGMDGRNWICKCFTLLFAFFVLFLYQPILSTHYLRETISG